MPDARKTDTRKPDTQKPSEKEIDRQMKDSFPASDPPSFSGGKHIIGAPKGRESDSPTARSPEVKDAQNALHHSGKK